MSAYRVYQLDPAGRIVRAEWLEAETDAAAETLALKLCGPGVPMVELWQAARRIAVLSCGGDDAKPASGRRASFKSAERSAERPFRQPAGRAVDWLRLHALPARARGAASGPRSRPQ